MASLEIDRDKLTQKLDSIPEQDREPYLQALKAKGYTWKSNAPQTQLTTALKSQSFWDKTKDAAGAVWRGLAIPEKLSRQGLSEIAAAIPGGEDVGTGPLGTASNAAKATTEALAQVAPGFVSRGAILTAGALKGLKMAAPAIKAVGGAVGKGAESISGLEYKTPGILAKAANDPGLIFGPGKEAAGEAYEAAKDVSAIRPEIGEALDHPSVIQESYNALKEGTLTPDEALVARQSLDASQKTMPKGAYIKLRDAFDAIAKQKFKSSDAAYVTGRLSDALRQPLPVNKLGGTSIAKSVLGSIAGIIPVLTMSPVVQGTIATALGLGAKGAAAIANLPPQDILALYGSLTALKKVRQDQPREDQ